jgi:hypothetical protein
MGMGKTTEADIDDMPALENLEDDNTNEENGVDDDGGNGAGQEDYNNVEDEVDEFAELSQDEQDQIVNDTVAVQQAVSKLQQLSFAVI